MARIAKLTSQELSDLMLKISLLLEAGFTVQSGMNALIADGDKSDIDDFYRELAERVEMGGTLYDAIKDDDRFPDYCREMIEVGEKTGKLQDVTRALSAYYERQGRVKKALQDAVTYPITLSVMLMAVALVTIIWVLPVFRRVLNDMGTGDMGVMNFGAVIGWAVVGIIAVALVLVAVVYFKLRSKDRKKVLAFLEKELRFIKRISDNMTASRLADALYMGITAGFNTDEALEMAEDLMPNDLSKEKVSIMLSQLHDGESFDNVIRQSGIFKELHVRMIKLGAGVGNEQMIFAKLRDEYQTDTEDAIEKALAVTEPVLITLICVVVGGVLLSVMLPMAGILAGMI